MNTAGKPSNEPSLAFGGQALIEGVMMRSGTHMVLCVRQPDNKIITRSEKIHSLTHRNKVLALPFIRGIIMLFETMYYGVKGMFFSANQTLDEDEEPFQTRDYLIVIAMVVVMNGFFMVVPFILTTYLKLQGIIFNVVESLLRLSLFIFYLYLISRWGEFARVLQYHGAEHKTINAYEAGAPMNSESVKTFSRLNPRCGTSFLFIVVLISIVLFSLIPRTSYLMRIAYRLLLIPVIGAISYELLKFSDKHRESLLIKMVTIPGLLFQRFTTKEPDEDMIEVAIAALQEIKKLSS